MATKIETLTQSQLTDEALDLMDDGLKISKRQANDFLESARAAIEQNLNEGKKVSVWGIVILNQGFKLAKPRRKGMNPRSGQEEWLKAQPDKVTLKASVAKRLKDALPSAKSKAAEPHKKLAEKRAKEARKRAREAAKEAA